MKLNHVSIIGNLVRDPEPLRYLQSGTCVGRLSFAINEVSGTGDSRKEEVHFIDVTTWGKTAENCLQYLTKGQEALIIGRIRQEKWQTTEGESRSRIVIVANQVQFGRKPKGAEPPAGERPGLPAPGTPEYVEDAAGETGWVPSGYRDEGAGTHDDLPF